MSAHQTHETLPRAGDPGVPALIASMSDPAAFGHPVSYIKLIETHISWILLTGEFAYKIKKAVDFGFLDFSTLEKRRHFCREELRLNRRFAPNIYLEVVEIRGSEGVARIGGGGEVVEYAIKMREFPQDCLLSRLAGGGELPAEIVDAIADRVSRIHGESALADPASDYGSAAQASHWSEENLVHIASAIPPQYLPNGYFALKRWYRENEDLIDIIERRRADGHVRDCHGDLHLGNMALVDGEVTLFDCIEFNPALRWIDTVSETAFVAMDLHARGYPRYCWRFLNRYFENSGDYDGIRLLRYYFVYRALVRAKVEALRVDQEALAGEDYREHIAPAIDYIELASAWAGSHRAGLILMHGLSASGKSTVAAQLARALGAIRVRSDVERKRLFGLAADVSSGSALDSGIYTAAATAATYERLRDIAAGIIAADFSAIVDATLLKAGERQALLQLPAARDCKRVIIDCVAPPDELRRRIVARQQDASEAGLEVLERQLQTQEPLGGPEREQAAIFEVGPDGLDDDLIEAIRACLFS